MDEQLQEIFPGGSVIDNGREQNSMSNEIFKKVTSESVGIKSECLEKFINHLQNKGIVMHDVVMAKGDNIFFEAYWKPFDKDFCHRQYSQTKSFVGIAIGLLEEEGKLNLGDKIADYFRDKIERELPIYLENQTIKDMLTMTTSCECPSWSLSKDQDRVHLYFNESLVIRPSGTMWEYDSAGSQVLSALVERLSGKSLLAYLKEKLFDEMHCFKTATVLKVPTGEEWGDSAMVCRPYDMLAFGRFVMNGGTWRGKRLMNEAYLREATSAIVYNSNTGHLSARNSYGYGYQIWRIRNNSFAFVGMGQQLTICVPDKDIIFVCNSDVQGSCYPYDTVIDFLFDEVIEKASNVPLPEDKKGQEKLTALCDNLKLRAISGMKKTKLQQSINGKIYKSIGENTPQISELSLRFDENGGGVFEYTNLQGKKQLPFKMNDNWFGKFPQLGYSNEIGNLPTMDGFMYDCAVSAAWKDEHRLQIFVQIIDKYFGNCTMTFSFKDAYLTVEMTKVAEGFLEEYEGIIVAKHAR